jgi:hypothetical protein
MGREASLRSHLQLLHNAPHRSGIEPRYADMNQGDTNGTVKPCNASHHRMMLMKEK